MNPGTTIIILLGIIGLLLYASQALKTTKEGFALVDDDQISTKSKEAMDDLKQGTLNFQSLMSAFSTPDLNTDPKTPQIGLGGPSIGELVAGKDKGPSNELMPSVKAPDANPLSPLPPPPAATPLTALPVAAPASALAPTPAPPAQTVSDSQGLALLKPEPPAATPAPSISSIAATAGSTKDKVEPMENLAMPPVIAASSDRPVKTPLTRTRVRTRVIYKPRKCPTVDLSQYVRKDAIPCWGCNLK